MPSSRVPALILTLLILLIIPLSASAQTSGRMYEVTITNITGMQVLSPPLLATHNPSMHVWQMGQMASDGLRMIAEEGMNPTLAAALQGSVTEVKALAMDQMVMPGQSVTANITANEGDVLSVATMLGQTNDGFTGLDSMALSGAMMEQETMAYDAGTEDNTEMAEHVPGAPFMGMMMRVPTDPQQPIVMHPGISGMADVGPEFGWSGPVARITVRAAPAGMPQTGETPATSMALYLAAGGLLLLAVGVGVQRRLQHYPFRSS